MAASSSSPILPPGPPQREYDVFLSFSGLDSRKNIISHLQAAFKRNNFSTFKDDKNLDRGKDIAAGLFDAIKNSSMSIVVFSKNYFASKWCLTELEKIMEYSKNLHHIVIPIFVDIEPSGIRNLKGSIAETLAQLEEVPENWRATLTEVASLAGFVCNSDKDEASLVEDIVERVQGELSSRIPLNVAKHPVGIEPRLQKVLKELCLESSDDVRIVAIWGVGGLGKTTIAKAAYNCIRSGFEGCSFVANVRETWEQSKGNLLALQKQILSDISKNENYKMGSIHEGVELLKRRAFYGRKVLIVLDDVDRVEQLYALAIDPSFLSRGSRIIVTTRDISSLNSLRPVLTTYELELLNMDESLQLFSLHAFNQHNPPEGFMELSNTVVNYARGIPLVLEVWGCFLNGNNDQSEWRSAIAKMKKIPSHDVQGKLRISFDSLDENEQKLFLDIAFFFFGEVENFTIQVLQDCGIFPKIGFRRLKNRCLLKCVGSVIVMHDIIKQMGREIVRQESVDYPGKRSRLCDRKDVLQVLKNCEGTEAIEGLILLHNGNDIKVKAKAFQNMTRLRVLHLDRVLLSAGYKLLFRNSGYKHLSRNLVWLRWQHFDLSVFPSQLNLENLVSLDLRYSNIKRVWRGTKILSKLKFLDLSYCHNLTTTPNFSGLPNLEELYLFNCLRLKEVDKSIGHLDKLHVLIVKGCKSLRKLLPKMGTKQDCKVLSKLKYLDFHDCCNLTTTPNFFWIPNLTNLYLRSCLRLQELDRSIGHLHKLRWLSVNCSSLRKLPLEMVNLKSLEGIFFESKGSLGPSLNFLQDLSCLNRLHMHGCSLTQLPDFERMISLTELAIEKCSLTQLPDGIGSLISLTYLDICHSKFSCLPESICNLTRLESLKIRYCDMSNLPSELGRLNRLEVLSLEGNNFCSLPESIGDLTKLWYLNLCDCKRLQSLPKLSSDRSVSVKVDNCASLRSFKLSSGLSMSCYNCPKLDAEYCAHKIGTNFLDYKVVGSFQIQYSEVMFPDWLQHETTNSYYALKAPRVGNKHFIRCIFYAAHPIASIYCNWAMQFHLHNKTKDVFINCYCSFWPVDKNSINIVGDQIIFRYYSFHVDKLKLEEGDEIEISWIPGKNVVLKKWGVHVSYYTIDDHH